MSTTGLQRVSIHLGDAENTETREGEMGLLTGLATLLLTKIVRGILSVADPSSVHRYNAKFPPISDDEFVARCHLSVSLEVADGVRQTVGEIFGIAPDRVHPDTDLIKLDNLW